MLGLMEESPLQPFPSAPCCHALTDPPQDTRQAGAVQHRVGALLNSPALLCRAPPPLFHQMRPWVLSALMFLLPPEVRGRTRMSPLLGGLCRAQGREEEGWVQPLPTTLCWGFFPPPGG